MNQPRRRWLTLWPITLAIYWLAMFIGTHVPRVPPIHGVEPSDKVLHFLAYLGLVVLMAAAWATQLVLNWRHFGVLFIIAAVYGAIDELLQIPVGRSIGMPTWPARFAVWSLMP
jgi:VanZ family protein